jgi:hypothetical protein
VSAAALLAEAREAGVTLRLVGATPKVAGSPPPELLARLREARGEIVELLRGDRCRWCGERMAWPRPSGIVFADGTAECSRCEAREVERLLSAGRRAVESPDALADPAETMLRTGSIDNCTGCRLPRQLDSVGLCEGCTTRERRAAP